MQGDVCFRKLDEASSDAVSSFPWRRVVAFASASALSAALLLFCPLPYSLSNPLAPTDLVGHVGPGWGGHASCPKETGGTCSYFGCASWRGTDVKCINGHCICGEGSCSDGDRGICRPKGSCPEFTKGTCNLLPCKVFRGPTTCEREGGLVRKCKCAEGWCALDNVCVQNISSLKANVVLLDDSHTKFPGRHANVRTAMSCGGGGSRAQAICMGLLRAFEKNGLMKSVDMLASVSGGTWAAAPYMFSDMSIDDLLGKSTHPEQLTMDELQKPPGWIARKAETNLVASLADEDADTSVGPHSAWVEAISRNFLDDFGLGASYSRLAATSEDVERIKRDNPGIRNDQFLVPQPGRPRVFLISGSIIKPVGTMTNPDAITDFQMSPDYTGAPFFIHDRTMNFQVSNKKTADTVGFHLGGGFVETFAFGGPPPVHEASGMVELPAPSRALSLAHMVALSSNFYAGKPGGFKAMKDAYWGVGNFRQKQQLQTFEFGDGGLLDNNALFPALQRGVEKFVFMIPTELPFQMEPDYCGGEAALGKEFDKHWSADDISDKFGYGKCSDGFFKCHNQVFDKKDYIPLLCDMKKTYESEGMIVLRKKLKLVDNGYYQIKGGRTVDFIFVYNTVAHTFVKALPKDTKYFVDGGDRGAFPGFPQYDTFSENGQMSGGRLTYPQINLLAAHTEFLVMSKLRLFQDFFASTSS